MPKTFVIGDIHGCNDLLLQLLDKIGPIPPEARLVFLGDYIDRGPRSKAVIDTVLGLRRQYPYTMTLMGNHERMLLDYLMGINQKGYLRLGGAQTLESYGITPEEDAKGKFPAAHIRFFNELLHYWEDDQHIFVHAGIEPGVPMALQSEEWLLWSRNTADRLAAKNQKTIIYGHSAFKNPQIGPESIGIDTGAVYGGNLTCLLLPDHEFIQVRGVKFWP